MEPTTIELFDAYIGGDLGPEDHVGLEQRLASDPGLNAEFTIYKMMVTGIQENRRKELKTFISRNVRVKPMPFYRTTAFYASAAASVVLCLISYFVIFQKLKESNPYSERDATHPPVVKQDSAHANQTTPVAVEPQRNDSQPQETYTETPIVKNGGGLKDLTMSEPIVNKFTKKDPAQEVIVTDKLMLDTFLNIDRKVYMAKPKQYQKDPSDVRAVVVTADKRRLEVQFWKSPVNYHGYRFVKNALTLYGEYDPANASFQELKSDVYMKYKSEYYMLSPTDNFIPVVKVTDSKLISDLEVKPKN